MMHLKALILLVSGLIPGSSSSLSTNKIIDTDVKQLRSLIRVCTMMAYLAFISVTVLLTLKLVVKPAPTLVNAAVVAASRS